MTFSPFSKEEIKNPKFYNNILARFTRRKTLNFADYFGNGEEQNYWWNLKKRLEETLKIIPSFGLTPEDLKKYKDLYLEICFFLLYHLDDKEIFDLLKKYFIFAIKSGIDIRERLQIKAQTMVFFDARDKFLQDVHSAIKENEELLGNKEIDIKDGGRMKRVKPHLKNWFSDFENTLGAGMHGVLETTNYFFRSQNVKTLNIDERKLLRNIIELHELLKLKYIYPDSLSGVSPDIIGFRKVGEGVKSRYVPKNPQVIAFMNRARVVEKPKKEEPKFVETRKELPRDEIVKKVSSVPAPKMPIPTKTLKAVPERKKMEEGLGGKPIPQNAITKLNSIERLTGLSIIDFRFFSQNPREAARFMFNKLRKLVMQSPAMRLQIQDSFKNTELYKLYLSIGKEAVDSRKTIREISDFRRRQGREFMSEEEYRTVGAIAKAI